MMFGKKLACVALMSLGLLVSGVASAKAKFYFNVCVDSSQSVANGGLIINGLGIANVAPKLYRPNNLVGLNTQSLTVPDCRYNYVGYMAEVTGKGDYADWKINDGQSVSGAVIVFNLSDIPYVYIAPNGVLSSARASCGDVRISLNFYVTSLTGDYRNFTPDGPNGLIKIMVTANQDKSLTCRAVH